ncbi:MAG: DUF4956 domain-containing protein [Lachnospiraceae bacterium]|nr:DUF4956 domain-containing protein [Lachnospiraceae bacterium]
MFESLLGTINDGSIETTETLLCMLFAVVLGIIIATVYVLSIKKEEASVSFFITLIILPAIVALVITLVGSNIARALSIGGVFTLVRFRSAQGDAKDISFVFLAMGAGLAAGLGFLTVAFWAVVVLGVVIFAVSKIAKKVFETNVQELKIVIPEDMNYSDTFAQIFGEYTDKADLTKVKTTNMGTLYELTYHVLIKDKADEKQFIDEIRTKNGNLNVTLAKQLKKDDRL